MKQSSMIKLIFTTFLFACASFAHADESNHTPVVQLSAEQDHARIMKLLNMTSIRRGADGSGNPDSEFAANYDETKANDNMHSLPPVLKMLDGREIKTQDEWWKLRRPEIVELFKREIYGRVPENVPSVSWTIKDSTESVVGDTDVVVETLVGVVDNSSYPLIAVNIDLKITRPANVKGSVPVIMGLEYDEATLARFRKMFSEEQLKSFRGDGPPWQEQVIARGWATAEYVPYSVQADNGAGLTQGIIGLVNNGQARKLEDWGGLRAWAWGASRALDFIDSHNALDGKRVAIEGHSRFGKAALVATAFDDRFASGFISSSGEAGAKLWRRNYGEQVGNIAGSGEYHWMAPNFIKYAGPLTVNDIPVDAHALIALAAPRPIFISSGNVGDAWVDAKGMFLAALHASPAYELLGKKGLSASKFPAVETDVMGGDVSYRQHNGGHTPGPNWPTFLDFVARYF